MLKSVLTIDMERAGRLLAKLKAAPGGCEPEELAKAAWAAAVGGRISAVSRALGMRGRRLIVEVDDSVWWSHLSALRPHILKNIDGLIGSEIVADIELRVKIPRRMPRREESAFRAGGGRLAVAVGSALAPGDEANGIPDPVLRRNYIVARKKAGA